MKIALPVENGLISGHFGHAPQFAIVEVADGNIAGSQLLVPPPHEPGSLPRWLSGLGVTHIICGGIGGRAVELLSAAGIQVIAGTPVMDPAAAVERFLRGELSGVSGPTCEGHHGGHACSH